MVSFLDKKTETQNQQIAALLREELAELKTDIISIKEINEKLILENIEMRTELLDVKKSNMSMQKQIKNLESDLNCLKTGNIDKNPQVQISRYEDTIREVQERADRQKNIIIAGIDELKAGNIEQRRKHDYNEVLEILKSIYTECPCPVKLFRLGKSEPGKHRLIKVCFSAVETAKYLLRKQNKDRSKVRLFSDQTPAQKSYMQHIKEELARRESNGELNLTIKYIRDIPQIVKNHPKNDVKKSLPTNH